MCDGECQCPLACITITEFEAMFKDEEVVVPACDLENPEYCESCQ